MTYKQYCELTKAWQLIELPLYGEYLCSRVLCDYHFILYKLNSFYVECIFCSRTGKILAIAAFTDIYRLDPYLDTRDITNLATLNPRN